MDFSKINCENDLCIETVVKALISKVHKKYWAHVHLPMINLTCAFYNYFKKGN